MMYFINKSILPFLLRDNSLYGINTTRIICLTRNIPSNHSSDECQRENDEQADACYGNLSHSAACNS